MLLLRRFVALEPAQRGWLLGVLPLVVFVRLILWFASYRRARILTRRIVAGRRLTGASPDDIVWAITATSRYVPRATCLTQALVAEALLPQAGVDGRLRIGVARDAGANRFEAHAWVEHGDRILIGEVGDMTRFTLLPDLPDRP
jgi:hypothetical protein